MRLLIVEDDQDGREMLTELFRMHAWQVTPVPSTAAAMVELRAGGFDVVISDENLAGASGSAMLREASEQGLLRDVGALMYTAEPGDLELPPGVRVLKKPLGIAQLVDEVKAALGEAPGSGERVKAARTGSTRVELVLYVTGSEQSRRALRAMRSVLEGIDAPRVKVIIRNLDHEPLAAADEPIPVTPVLVKNRPGAEERFVGNLDSTRSLAALIHDLECACPPSSRQAR
jgi:DNA-binding NtrC family response regulator